MQAPTRERSIEFDSSGKMATHRCVQILVILVAFIGVAVIEAKPKITPRIYGGNYAKPAQIPFIASLRIFSQKTQVFKHSCGASILTNTWLISAAHCFDKQRHPTVDEYRVFVGTIGMHDGIEYKVKKFVRHTTFLFVNLRDDIMLIQTTNSIEFTQAVQPIPLQRKYIEVDVVVFAAGWGANDVRFRMIFSLDACLLLYSFFTLSLKDPDDLEKLKYVELKTVPNADCERRMAEEGWENIVWDTTLCASAGKYCFGIGTGDSGLYYFFLS